MISLDSDNALEALSEGYLSISRQPTRRDPFARSAITECIERASAPSGAGRSSCCVLGLGGRSDASVGRGFSATMSTHLAGALLVCSFR